MVICSGGVKPELPSLHCLIKVPRSDTLNILAVQDGATVAIDLRTNIAHSFPTRKHSTQAFALRTDFIIGYIASIFFKGINDIKKVLK